MSHSDDTPKYVHDCDRCTFLGRFTSDGTEYDLYYADHGGLPDTVIARYGDEGSDYASGMHFPMWFYPELEEAKRLAKERGLIHETLPSEVSQSDTTELGRSDRQETVR